ncbi:MAG: ADP-ribosylation factor-like protein [Candidatus Thorarchaeota archaeon]
MSMQIRDLFEYKIVIAGLDNAGKTSALIALRMKYNFYERVKDLKPTIKIDYSSFKFLKKYHINLWDMGGQKKFRQIYISNPIYFSETNYIYYLIDIQDELKFEESVEYLHNLLNIYRDLGYSNEIIVCFSKYDPKYRQNEDYVERIKMLENLILSQNKDLKFKFFNFSYYDISSISKALSYALNQLLKLDEIEVYLENLISKFGCNYAILYTNSGIIIADQYQNILDLKAFEENISSRINTDLEFFQRLVDEEVNINERATILEGEINYVREFQIRIGDQQNIFYLGINTALNNFDPVKAEFNKFQAILNKTFI